MDNNWAKRPANYCYSAALPAHQPAVERWPPSCLFGCTSKLGVGRSSRLDSGTGLRPSHVPMPNCQSTLQLTYLRNLNRHNNEIHSLLLLFGSCEARSFVRAPVRLLAVGAAVAHMLQLLRFPSSLPHAEQQS